MSAYSEVEPLTVFRRVEVWPQVELVVSLSDSHHLGQVARLKARLKLEAVGQGGEVNFWIDRCRTRFWRPTIARRTRNTPTKK